jgi:hypothetical protein
MRLLPERSVLATLCAMARRLAPFVLSIFTQGLVSGAVFAAEPEGCPPDEWFCDEGEAPAAPPASEPGSTEVPPEPASESSAPPSPHSAPRSRNWTSDEPSGGSRRMAIEPSRAATRDAGRRSEQPELAPWSVNLRLEGVLLGESRRNRDTGMGGVGVSLRYLVSPVLSLDVGLDSIFGTDYQGNDRGELTMSFSTLLYFSQHPSVRSYALLGLNWSAANVDVGDEERSYAYLGAHAGIGLDVPLDQRVAFNLDLLGFVRGRTDSRAAFEPEFTDGFGRVSNTAGGGMFRAGVTLFWY